MTATLTHAQKRELKRQRKHVRIDAWKARNRYRYPSEARLEAAAVGQPLPGRGCSCDACVEKGAAPWPVPYIGSCGISFECWIEGHEPPAEESASSRALERLRQLGAVIPSKVELATERTADLKRYIAAYRARKGMKS